MLQEYSAGTGSMAAEAEMTADSWDGAMNRLSNTWTDTVGKIADSDAVITGINVLNELLSTAQKAIDTFGALPVAAGAAFMAINTNKGGGLVSWFYPSQQILLS